MEVEDSPLNLAHQQSRKADRLLAAAKYEEAISCHSSAADLLRDAMKLTQCEQARLSMELQKDSHVKQQRLIQERWKREARRGAAKTSVPARPTADPAPAAPSQPLPPTAHQSRVSGGGAEGAGGAEREYDTLLYQLQSRQVAGPLLAPAAPRCPGGSKTAKDDKTRLEEQRTTMDYLRRLLGQLMDENQRLSSENQQLQAENARLSSEVADAADLVERSELWVLPHAVGAVQGGAQQEKTATGKGKDIAIPQLPPLEMPAQEDLCLDDLPPLELPEDIQHELQELLDRDKL
ncbi:unnamed protein product [Merluccius merluccius]